MTLRTLTRSAAVLSLLAGTAAPVLAQTAAAPVDLPAPLAALNLTGVDIETKRNGLREVEGRTADGIEIEALIDPAGNLLHVEADDGALPTALLEAVLPQAVRGNEVFGQFAAIDGMHSRDGRFMIQGEDAGGEDMRAAFDPDGRVLRFGREDERRDHGRGHREGRDHDRRAMHDRAMRPGGPQEGGPAPMHADIDAVAINRTLTAAGYTDFGLLQAFGPHLSLQATNPQGEAVTLELDPQGEVLRETAR